MRDEEIIICRCEDVTLAEVRAAIAGGYTDFEELKRFLRVGMGPCGGRTCIPLVRKELARFLGKTLNEVSIPKQRPPTQVTTFGAVSAGTERSER